jgi:hypothetical protein
MNVTDCTTVAYTRNSVQANQQSPLLRLPTELRTKIWTYVLGSTIYRGKGYTYTGEAQFVPRDRSIGLSLLQTCRQVYPRPQCCLSLSTSSALANSGASEVASRL